MEKTNRLIYFFSDMLQAPFKVGGKAFHLADLQRHGLPVPQGFLFRANQIPKIEECIKAIEQIGGFPVAVRSSGALEDLSSASFAGIYESYLNIDNEQSLEQAINDCLHSATSERALSYCEKALNKKMEPAELKESFQVFIQKMVNPDFAGVAFTLNPLNGKEEEFLGEYVTGTADRLVSGEVNPDRFIANTQLKKLTTGDEKQWEWIEKIVDLGIKVQAIKGCPQDIEWAVLNQQVYLLQARPITKIKWREDHGELSNADFKDGGVSARVCTPLMFSLYKVAMTHSLPDYMQKVGLIKEIENRDIYIKHLYGRVFWNAGEVKKALKKVPGYDEEKFDRDLGVVKDYGLKGPERTGFGPLEILRGIPILIGLYREFTDCQKMVLTFSSSFPNKYQQFLKLLESSASLPILLKAWEKMMKELYQWTESSYFRTIYNNSNYQTEFKNFLKGIEKKSGRKINSLALFSALPHVAHMEIQKDLMTLIKVAKSNTLDSQEYQRARAQFLEKHDHHGPAELDLTIPRWGENPADVDQMVSEMLNVPQTMQSSSGNAEQLYQSEVQKVIKDIDSSFGIFKYWQNYEFKRRLKRVRWFLSHREQMRTFSTKAYFLIRLYLKKMATFSNIPLEELYYGYYSELANYLSSPSSELKSVWHSRKLNYQGFSNFTPPDDFGYGKKEVDHSRQQEGNTLMGVGCSPGIIEGRAVVIFSPAESGQIQSGDILVTRFTDPGWTPLLGRVTGVVTEVGGVLSHAAVIGREYGIPAVLNVPGATTRIQTGTRIKVNGDSGEVIIQ